jgi:hypothetical protein
MTRPTDQGLTFLLVLLFLVVFVAQPFFAGGAVSRFVTESLLSLVILFAATAVPRPRLRHVAFGLAGAAIVTRWLTYVVENESLVTVHVALEVLFLWLAVCGLLLRVFSRGRVTLRQIQGAVAIYLLIGLAFSEMYFLLELLQPGAFALGKEGATVLGSVAADFNYFSFVTLTTVGYGDITPLSAGARQLTVLEGLIGQLFPAVLLARLVSMEIGSSAREG